LVSFPLPKKTEENTKIEAAKNILLLMELSGFLSLANLNSFLLLLITFWVTSKEAEKERDK